MSNEEEFEKEKNKEIEKDVEETEEIIAIELLENQCLKLESHKLSENK